MGKPEVVLDAGARARLATGSAALQYHHVEPFRCGIDGRGEPGGPAPTTMRSCTCPSSSSLLKPSTAATSRIARIAQRPVPVPAHQHRDVTEADLEVLEQRVHAPRRARRRGRRKDVRCAQEGLEAEGIRRVVRPDQHGAAEIIGNQVRAAEREGAQKQLAQLGVRLHDVPEVRQVDLEQLGSRPARARRPGSAARRSRPPPR